MSSDDRLARRAAQGDQRAFAEIYERYGQSLYRFCLAMVGDPQDAQDTLQNTMVKVLRNLPGERREIKLKPWLYRIARNEAIETLRKRRDTATLEPHQAMAVGLTETAEARDRLRTLLADLDELPERQRAALVMRELSGLDFDQIGAAFGTSAAVARQTLYEARLSLRQLEAGREMRCTDVMRELSDADGRVTRRREIRAHLRNCADCRAFRDQIAKRPEDLAALAPLPLAASAGLLQSVLDTSASAVGSGVGGAVGAGAGKAITASVLAKSAATAAVAVTLGAAAADRSGVVDLPLPGRDQGSAPQSAPAQSPSDAAGEERGASTAGEPGDSAGAQSGDAGQQAGTNSAQRQGEQASANGRAATSPSQAGDDPPGGGYGRSAAQRKGRPEQLPAAAEKGQQTAAAHRADQAASAPGKSGAAGSGGKPSDSPPGSSSPAQEEAPPPSAPEPPPQAQGGAAQGKQPATPPGLER